MLLSYIGRRDEVYGLEFQHLIKKKKKKIKERNFSYLDSTLEN